MICFATTLIIDQLFKSSVCSVLCLAIGIVSENVAFDLYIFLHIRELVD